MTANDTPAGGIELVRALRLENVYYFVVDGRRLETAQSEPAQDEISLQQETQVMHAESPERFAVRIRTRILAPDAEYKVDVCCDYKKESTFTAPPAAVQEFVERSAYLVAWPYIRSAVSDLSLKLRTTPIVLGLVEPGQVHLAGAPEKVDDFPEF